MDLDEALAALSDDAKAAGAAWFGMMRPGQCSGLHFSMEQYRPSPRSQAALDELERAGLVSCVRKPDGSILYLPLESMSPLYVWVLENPDSPALRFQLVERIDGAPAGADAGTMTLRTEEHTNGQG